MIRTYALKDYIAVCVFEEAFFLVGLNAVFNTVGYLELLDVSLIMEVIFENGPPDSPPAKVCVIFTVEIITHSKRDFLPNANEVIVSSDIDMS